MTILDISPTILILIAFLSLGFYRNRKFLVGWSKNWWEQIKIVWGGKNDKR
ncbi:hypothetical protein LCGC14_1596510 [marine sediment metagenome]|uniref:Uncharacterized protein n=1 Tax=marine sediment metagenome TaxID=412755 RepID=A0A0F9IYT2_9ZZZZ